jgi:hypothetical protein
LYCLPLVTWCIRGASVCTCNSSESLLALDQLHQSAFLCVHFQVHVLAVSVHNC